MLIIRPFSRDNLVVYTFTPQEPGLNSEELENFLSKNLGKSFLEYSWKLEGARVASVAVVVKEGQTPKEVLELFSKSGFNLQYSSRSASRGFLGIYHF